MSRDHMFVNNDDSERESNVNIAIKNAVKIYTYFNC